MILSQQLKKYLIFGTENCKQDPILTLKQAIHGGITAFQYREKALKGGGRIQLGKQLREVCREHEIPFFVNDDLELALALDADGIHVGQEDDKPDVIQSQFPNLIIGLSLSTWEEVKLSPVHLVDYIGAGPIFPTTTKKDAKKVTGVQWLTQLKETFPSHPLVGIGGITHRNAHKVYEAGADGAAVISAITEAPDIPEAVRRLD